MGLTKPSESIELKTFKGVSWLALFKFASQVLSWAATIIVANLLAPGDYGLMAMAGLITGYAEIFSELGLGAAIIQKSKIKQLDLSSVFWLSFGVALFFAVACFPIAYLTSFILNEPRVIPITKTVSIIFLLFGLQVVPFSLLKKNMEFKTVGFIEMSSTTISCAGMIIIAYLGGGVWTLIGGRIIRAFFHLVMVYSFAGWFPKLYLSLNAAKSYIKFGITMATGRSLFYIWEQSDKFFAARMWTVANVGLYSFALQLAQIPTEKIVVLINQVSYSAFSKLQNDSEKFNQFYLNITKITATLVLPLFIGGFLVGDDLIRLILSEQWYPMIFLFKYLCLSQILLAINAVNNFVHAAQGRPVWGLYYHIACVIFMPISFYFGAKHGLHTIILPWLTTYVLLSSTWIFLTIRKIGIRTTNYVTNLLNPLIATFFMIIGVVLFRYLFSKIRFIDENVIVRLPFLIGIGAICYLSYLWIFERKLFINLKNVLKS